MACVTIVSAERHLGKSEGAKSHNIKMSKAERLYQLERPPFTSREFHTKFTNLVGPLSLFEPEDSADIGNENPEVERPLTPIEDAVKSPPSSFSAFAKLVHPRLSPREGIIGLSVNDQQQLIGILISELNNIWRDVQRGPPDPFLTSQQNRELQRRLTIEIVIITQGLFAKYLDKAQKLNQRGVFSGPANLSRLKTQLALEANKSLNVLSLRRNLAADLKHPSDTSTVSSRFSITRPMHAPPPKLYRPLVTRQEDRKGKVHLTRAEKQQQWIDRELSDLQKKMPHMEPGSFQIAFPNDLSPRNKSASDSDSVMEESISQERTNDARLHFMQQKHASLPELFSRDAVLEELGVLPEDIQDYVMNRSQSEAKLTEEKTVDEHDADRTASIKLGASDHASQDLVKLLGLSSSGKRTERLQQGEEENDDLPPLLQALARHSTTDRERDQRKQRRVQKEVESKDDQDDSASVTSSIQSTEASSVANDPTILDENITEFTGEEHPQPAVVSLRLPDKSVVRTSDVRVSNRVNKASVTLNRYPTVYNDLTGEIDAPTVKWLDKNLFIGEEIKEVYEEIIKTIGTDHLLFDQDAYVEKSADDVDVCLCTSSSSLVKPRAERILNQNLKKDIPPPWGSNTADNWRNSPKFGGLGREDILQAKLKKGEDNGHGKSYNSWLAWWRSTITTDDFLKFLSTQENDYMSLLFHLYDSDHEADDEDDGDEARPDTIQMALSREREKKLAELKSIKTEYQPGVWNANSVLLGGLGNEPDVDEKELLANLEDTFPPLRSVTPSKQSSGAVASPSARSFGSAKSSASRITTANSDQQRLEGLFKASSVGVIPQPAGSLGGGDTVSTSEATSLLPQDRLERVWTLLCMPDTQRLDMAIKYSAEPYSNNLLEALTFWEIATEVILQRESLMTKLEDFERTASDPNRFFAKDITGSSAARIRESKTRDSFNKRLSQIESQVRKAVTNVHRQCGDTVTFQGRPYLEKISMDRTEMFYWLQQERRQQVMDRELVKMRELTLKTPDLPPIPAHTIL